MIEIAQTHKHLIADVLSTETQTGQGAFWWLGQHTFIVKVSGKIIYIDPWFAPWEARQTPTLLDYSEGQHADIVLVTHGHGDHLCPETLKQMVSASPNAIFVCPRTEAHRLREEAGVPDNRIRPIDAGGVIEIEGAKITAIKSKHETFDEHLEHGFPYLGYVVEIGGVTFYHAGDTIMYDGLLTTLQQWKHFDAMFLPINGRDAVRFKANCMGNFTFQEAAELAGELKPSVAVPAHYDMFIGNQEDPTKFVDFLEAKYPGVKSWVGPVGERVLFP